MNRASPPVSVVMGVHNGAALLNETIESVLTQSLSEFEFIIVNDGSTEKEVKQCLDLWEARDPRITTIHKINAGLTKALIDGCRAAAGKYIARIDVGDSMHMNRLQKQAGILDENSDCHLVTSHVQFCAPNWEPLWITCGKPESSAPQYVVSEKERDGLKADIPHHGSVMFRKTAYEQVGGYRSAFYYGQDWDLWYRLAEHGKFYAIQEALYRARFFPDAISMSQSERQKKLAKCSLEGHLLRKKGLSDASILERAAQIRSRGQYADDTQLTDGNYFIGEALRREGNVACRRYFYQSIQASPFKIRGYLRLIQSLYLR